MSKTVQCFTKTNYGIASSRFPLTIFVRTCFKDCLYPRMDKYQLKKREEKTMSLIVLSIPMNMVRNIYIYIYIHIYIYIKRIIA